MSAVAPIEIENPEVWRRLETSPQWAALTNPQRIWVLDFLASGGSALSATKAGYNAKSEANARVLSYELAKNPTIVAALDVAAGRTPKADARAIGERARTRLLREVRKQLRAAEEGSVAATKLTAQLERLTIGGKPEVDDDEEPEPAEALRTESNSTSRVPAGATALADKNGVVRGYRTADGEYVQLADVEASK